MEWQIQEAKQRFSELVRQAEADGPQVVTRHGREVVVVIAAEEYRRLHGGVPDFKDFLVAAPDLSLLDMRRDEGRARTIDLPPTRTTSAR
jgi:prevent-host-death family protein